MTRLKPDENLSRHLKPKLSTIGHDTTTTAEENPLSKPDSEVSRNEWARAVNLGEAYWLYVIYNCGTPTPRLVRVQDPFNKLLAKVKGSVLISPREVVTAAE